MSNENDAVDALASVAKSVVAGWPVYCVVGTMLWAFGELWLDKKIGDAINMSTEAVPAVVSMTNAVQNNTNSINRVEAKVEEVEGDTKAILLHLAGGRINGE